MLVQTFVTEVFSYRTPAEMSTAAPFAGYPEDQNIYLVTSPRIYGEEWFTGFDGESLGWVSNGAIMFVGQESIQDGYEVIYLWMETGVVFRPRYGTLFYRFNATTGGYLGLIDGTVGVEYAGPYYSHIAQAFDGTIWKCQVLSPEIYKCAIDPANGLIIDTLPTYNWEDYLPLTLGGAIGAFSVDTSQNVMMLSITSIPYMYVFNLGTRALLRIIALPGIPCQIMINDIDHCYVIGLNSTVSLVNFTLGVVQTVLKAQITLTSQFGAFPTVAWDGIFRRFLAWDNTPLTSSGQNTSKIYGYFPIPVATNIMKPIPLKPPRKYRTTPVLTRVYGDVSEPIGGVAVTFTSSDSALASFGGFPALTDGDGEAVINMLALDSGSITLTATATA